MWHSKCIKLNEGYVYIYCVGGGIDHREVKGREKNEVKEGERRVGYR